MLEIPNKLFEIDINDVEIGVSEIHLYGKDEIEQGQEGYRYNGKTKKEIKEWIGNEYIVIGDDSCCGDPIIAKIDEKDIPIYAMFHDDWTTLNKVSDSIEQYADILKMIDETDLENKDEINVLLEKIKQIVPNYFEYWNDLIMLAYDFYTE